MRRWQGALRRHVPHDRNVVLPGRHAVSAQRPNWAIPIRCQHLPLVVENSTDLVGCLSEQPSEKGARCKEGVAPICHRAAVAIGGAACGMAHEQAPQAIVYPGQRFVGLGSGSCVTISAPNFSKILKISDIIIEFHEPERLELLSSRTQARRSGVKPPLPFTPPSPSIRRRQAGHRW
jgi:hypothetical protein